MGIKIYQHQLHEHLQHIRTQIHTRRICEVFVDVTESAGRSQESVDRLIESSSCQAILLSGQLCVKCASIKENRCLFEGNGSLATRDSCQRIEPLEIDTEAPVGWKESPLYEVELIVITQE